MRTHYCGGSSYSYTCYEFAEGSWQRSTKLTQQSMMATSFDSSGGFVMLGAMNYSTGSMEALLVEAEDSVRPLYSLMNLAT